ncbi:MAG TPA: hypothetical protein VK348_09970 [Planctomycetota bacterium]|nr:hypothetical protein [Planctomycetota bacterium]
MRLAVLAILCGCAVAPPTATADDPLADLNRVARAAYAAARTRALANAGPVLIAGPEHVTLLHGGARDEFELLPARYQDLKSIAHLALGLHALWFQAVPDPASLRQLQAAAAKAVLALGTRGLSAEQIERQREIVRLSRAVDGAAALPAYERAVAPLLLANALDAARAEIADLDAVVLATRSALGPADFARLQVVVVGSHMAREGDPVMQYFEQLLGEREGLRLVFAEGLWDEAAELQLLGTHLLDASVGEGFFGDARRLHRDLLADAAARVLAERR